MNHDSYILNVRTNFLIRFYTLYILLLRRQIELVYNTLGVLFCDIFFDIFGCLKREKYLTQCSAKIFMLLERPVEEETCEMIEIIA